MMNSERLLFLLSEVRAARRLVDQGDIKALKDEGLIEADGSVRLFARCLTEKGQETLQQLERQMAFHFDVGSYEGWVYTIRDRQDGTEATRIQLVEKRSVNQGDFITADNGATFFRMAPLMFTSNAYIRGVPVSDPETTVILRKVVDEYAQGRNATNAHA